eukprot:TRINITY_DN29757_c0_g1_i2.p1 TRINITY_DN29757_c0_g1~~TRINITY_DN29757_c0_g1_i2.p1  ORF type:complete len:161 (+),score=5.13 TRINITY_DN29757_c0_g1_i2:451-933(+)
MTLDSVLRALGAVRMVVGHTIQKSADGHRVRAICEGKLILADTAISRAYGGEMSFLEHDGVGGVVAVYPGFGGAVPLPRPNSQVQYAPAPRPPDHGVTNASAVTWEAASLREPSSTLAVALRPLGQQTWGTAIVCWPLFVICPFLAWRHDCGRVLKDRST